MLGDTKFMPGTVTLDKLTKEILYVCFKFVWEEAVRIYYIPWPAEKLLPKIRTQTRLPKTAKICAACTANWPMLPKNELQKNIL